MCLLCQKVLSEAWNHLAHGSRMSMGIVTDCHHRRRRCSVEGGPSSPPHLVPSSACFSDKPASSRSSLFLSSWLTKTLGEHVHGAGSQVSQGSSVPPCEFPWGGLRMFRRTTLLLTDVLPLPRRHLDLSLHSLAGAPTPWAVSCPWPGGEHQAAVDVTAVVNAEATRSTFAPSMTRETLLSLSESWVCHGVVGAPPTV